MDRPVQHNLFICVFNTQGCIALRPMLYSIFVVNHDQTKTPVAAECSIINTDGSLNLSSCLLPVCLSCLPCKSASMKGAVRIGWLHLLHTLTTHSTKHEPHQWYQKFLEFIGVVFGLMSTCHPLSGMCGFSHLSQVCNKWTIILDLTQGPLSIQTWLKEYNKWKCKHNWKGTQSIY